MILVSACLAGRRTRYDGRSSPWDELAAEIGNEEWLAVCPEQMGGLPTPRPAASIMDGDGRDVLEGRARVIGQDGSDLTGNFLAGAEAVLNIALRIKAETVYLKDRSPSCGLAPFLDREGVRHGPGVCAALLKKYGFRVIEVQAKARD